MSEESLKQKTVKGTFWSAADAFFGHGVTFLVGIVLARILSPVEYGLIGICTIFTTILTGVVDSGFSNALIRKKDVSKDDYDTMFITNMLMSVLLYLLLWMFSPFIANFFERPELIYLIRAMGLVLILQALSIIQVTILTKKLDFKTKTKASIISALSSGFIGVIMAFENFGVWSLVFQILSRQLIYTICLWFFNRWWPSLRFTYSSFEYMWGFGWKLMVSGLLNSIWNQLYQVVVGKCYNPSTLGQYSRSKEYANLFSANFTAIVQRVTYPVLSKVQDDRIKLINAYRKIIKVSMFITVLCMGLLVAIAEPLIYCLIGPKWYEAATYLPLISISLSLYPLHANNLNMIQVQGRSDIFLYLEIIKKIISVIPLCLGIFINIYWMLIGSIGTGIISYFLNSYYSGRDFNYSSWMQIRDVAPSYLLAFLIGLPIYFLKFLPTSYFIVLPTQLVIAVLLLIFICEKTRMQEYIEVKQIVKQYSQNFLRFKSL